MWIRTLASKWGPVDLVVETRPQARGKVGVPTLEGMLGDVNTDGRVDLADGLLVAMYRIDPTLSLPNHGSIGLGDVDCNGRVERADVELLATYVVHPTDPAVSSLRIGQRGGYSLDPVTEMVWGSILGSEKKDAIVARILREVPVRLSGVMPIDGAGQVAIDGEDRLYLGIDPDYWSEHGGKHIYEALQQRFPVTPIHVEPSIGVVRQSGKVTRPPTTTAIRNVAPVTGFGPPISLSESPHVALKGPAKKQQVVGSITVPDDVTVGTVEVGVDITHPFRSDLKIDLVAPSGVATTLYDGVRDGINPAANIVEALPVTTALQGQPAQGTWHLRIGDYDREDTGTLNAWGLTITPASSARETQNPPHLFLDTFQEGLGAWTTTKWEAGSLGHDAEVPGEGEGNIVAKITGCPICFMILQEPLDLSAHESVTFSFYRWMDEGTGNGEFLGVDVGNGGQYQRLKTWNKNNADSRWHFETFTLTKDQIGDATSIRFFAIANNAFTTFAIDNIIISATPGSVVVEPIEPEEEEPEEEETVDIPDLSIPNMTTANTSVQPGDRIAIRITLKNEHAPTATNLVRVYRHTSETENPRQGGVPVISGRPRLQENSSRTVIARTTVPITPATYYYYACIASVQGEQDTANNCSPSVTVTVQQKTDTPPVETPEEEEPEEEPEEEEPTTHPDLSVADTVSLPLATVQSGDTITIQTTVTNTGDASAAAQISVYRHTRKTNNPRQGGRRETNTATTDTLAPGTTVSVTSTHRAPTVSRTTHYHYYVCVDTDSNEQNTADNCSENPATIVVRIKPEDAGPPYEHCYNIPERSTPMGGDAMVVQPIELGTVILCGTITLGGLETTDGTRGFVGSGHVIANVFRALGYEDWTTNTDALIGHSQNERQQLQHLLGKVFRTPAFRTEGNNRRVFIADAAFVAYPHPKTPGCSLTWSGDGEEFCLTAGKSDVYLDRVVPLTVRGENGTAHTVIGSQEPTADLAVQLFGSVSGTPHKGIVTGNRLLSQTPGENYYNYVYGIVTAGDRTIGGDSGAPVYTTPNAAGTVDIVGIITGLIPGAIAFASWSDVTQALDLKPIGN